MSKKMYVLETTTANIFAEINVNGISVSKTNPTLQKTSQLKLAPYMVEGKNRITLILAQPSESPPKLAISVLSGPKGTQPGDETLETFYEWSSELSPLPKLSIDGASPYLCLSFLASEIPEKAWYGADSLTLSGEDKASIKQILEQLSTALNNRDTESVMNILAIKHAELALALGCTEDVIKNSTQSMLNFAFNSPNWQVLPLEWDSVQYDAQANNKIFTVKDKSGEAFIRANIGGNAVPFDVSVAKIKGQWVVIL